MLAISSEKLSPSISMAIVLICGDGLQVKVPKKYFGMMSLFDNPDIASASSYTLRCKASSEVVRILMGRVEGKPDDVTITDENFNELRDLCYELGFSGLGKDLSVIEAEARKSLERQIFLLNNRITRHDKLLMEIQGQLALLLGVKNRRQDLYSTRSN